jgi:FkbM family methyltransferase
MSWIANKLVLWTSDLLHFGPQNLIRLIVSKITKRKFPIKLRTGQTIIVRGGNSDVATLRQIFIDGEYKIDCKKIRDRLTSYYETILSNGQIPLIGAASYYFSALFPKATVIAVEPEEANFQILQQNALAQQNIEAVEAAIGATAGFVNMKISKMSWGAQAERSEQGCPIITVSEILEKNSRYKLFLAKIDIEGFEGDLFSENTEWLDDVDAIFIEPHDWMKPGEYTSVNFQREIGRRKFELLIKGENLLYIR